jgi:hypothetical protein
VTVINKYISQLIVIKFYSERKFISKWVWCLNNFLTMQFYRKLCNKCYWENISSGHSSKIRKYFLLAVSVIPLFFISFFYMPTDPANSYTASYIFKFRSILNNLKIIIKELLNHFTDILIKYLHLLFNPAKPCYVTPQRTMLNLKSSYLI